MSKTITNNLPKSKYTPSASTDKIYTALEKLHESGYDFKAVRDLKIPTVEWSEREFGIFEKMLLAGNQFSVIKKL